MKLASYKSTRPGLQGLGNIAIRLRLRGQHSHTEVIFEPGDGVDHLMPDGTCDPDASGSLWCASSVAFERLPDWSSRRAGRSGGIRFKRIAINPGHWDVLPYRRDPVAAAQWFVKNEGALYDWQLILGFLVWLIPEKRGRAHCAEACAAAGGYDEAWRFDPCSLHKIVQAS